MTPPLPPVWAEIAETLRGELAAKIPPGARLPAEAQLAARFGVNRHTLRRALAALAAEGLVHARRGTGVFAAMPAVEYPLSPRPRYHAAVSASGQVPGRRILTIQEILADDETAASLEVSPRQPLLQIEGLNLSDGCTIGHFRSLFALIRIPGLAQALARTPSITSALAACGVSDYSRDWTRIGAVRADGLLARHLMLRPGDPVLRIESLNRDPDGRALERAVAHFAGTRVSLTMQQGSVEH